MPGAGPHGFPNPAMRHAPRSGIWRCLGRIGLRRGPLGGRSAFLVNRALAPMLGHIRGYLHAARNLAYGMQLLELF